MFFTTDDRSSRKLIIENDNWRKSPFTPSLTMLFYCDSGLANYFIESRMRADKISRKGSCCLRTKPGDVRNKRWRSFRYDGDTSPGVAGPRIALITSVFCGETAGLGGQQQKSSNFLRKGIVSLCEGISLKVHALWTFMFCSTFLLPIFTIFEAKITFWEVNSRDSSW